MYQKIIVFEFQVHDLANLHRRIIEAHCAHPLDHPSRLPDAWFEEEIDPDEVTEDSCHLDNR